jgi:hypothetical protein
MYLPEYFGVFLCKIFIIKKIIEFAYAVWGKFPMIFEGGIGREDASVLPAASASSLGCARKASNFNGALITASTGKNLFNFSNSTPDLDV